jgi:hypothetical protein
VANVGRLQGALKYLTTAALERTWRSSDTLTDATKSFNEFKDEMYKLYPGSSDDVFTIHHLDALLGQRARLGVQNATELGEFHLEFRTISKYLISKNRMSQAEQTRGFLRGLQPELENKVKQRLQIILPQHNPQDPYDLKDLYEAASFCLLGSAPDGSISATRSGASPAAPPISIKAELQTEVQSAIKSAVAEMTEMFKNVFAAQAQFAGGQASQAQNRAPTMARPQSSQNDRCNFCGDSGHFMRECEVAAEYARLGKCKRNVENKIVLPSGAVVPRSITGAWLRDRIDEYHRQNPNQLGAAQLFCEVGGTIEAFVHVEEEPSADNKIVRFEPEIGQPGVYAYKKQSSAKSKAKAAQDDPNPRIVEIRSDDDSAAEPAKFVRDFPPHIPQPPDSDTDGSGMEHPFAQPQPKTRNPLDDTETEAEAEAPPPRKSERAYTTSSQIYDEKVAQKVFEKILDTEITITQRQLLSLAPEICAKVTGVTARKRIVRTNSLTVQDEIAPKKAKHSAEAHMPAAFSKAIREPPADATIILDPYEAFLRARLCNDCSEDPIKVATESNSLRAILPVVAGLEEIEAILDPGCQIVAMSEEVCIALSIPYDPNVRLNMVSANGGVDQSLGLAKNVPFVIGEITVYLQVHILRQPAYDILLGRPFDVLTESIVRNYCNENQTITILDPNTGKRATVPTVKRGSCRFSDRRKRREAKSADF